MECIKVSRHREGSWFHIIEVTLQLVLDELWLLITDSQGYVALPVNVPKK